MRYSIVDEGGERQQHVESSKSVSWSTESPSVRLLQDNNNSDNCSPTSAKQQQRLLWYNKADLRRFREECEIAKIFSRKELGTNYTCHWGLEHVINEDNAIKRDNRRREAMDAVLDEQQAQREDDEDLDHSQEFMAELYAEISRVSHRHAQDLALQYHKELTQPQERQRAPSSSSATPEAKKKSGIMSSFSKNIRKSLNMSSSKIRKVIPPSA